MSELRTSTEENCPTCGCGGHETDDEDDCCPDENGSQPRKKRRDTTCKICSCACGGTSSSNPNHPHPVEVGPSTTALYSRRSGPLPTPPSSPNQPTISYPNGSDLASTSATERSGAIAHVLFSRTKAPHTVQRSVPEPSSSSSKRPPQQLSPPTSPNKCAAIPRHLLPPDPPLRTEVDRLSPTALYCAQRASPLICPNQKLVQALDIIRRSRELEGEARSALSYMRAIAALKAHPRRIANRRDIAELPHIGDKISNMVSASGLIVRMILTTFVGGRVRRNWTNSRKRSVAAYPNGCLESAHRHGYI